MATKIFPHAVIWNGELIPANTVIEIKEEKEKPAETVVKKNDKGTGRKA